MHVLLVGPPGSGKTAMMNDFINTLGKNKSRLDHTKLVFKMSELVLKKTVK